MFSVGDQADIYQWDLRMQKCLSKVNDEGSFSTTCVDVSPDGRYLATGSKMGTVNIFSLRDGSESALLREGQKPDKTVMNLTTSITDLKFGPTG